MAGVRVRLLTAGVVAAVLAALGLGAAPVGAAAASPPALQQQVQAAWSGMRWTVYAHHDTVDTGAGRYQFDCVGMTNYFLAQGARPANDELRSSLHVPAGKVPSPARMASFFAALPAQGSAHWLPVRSVGAISPGDVLVAPPYAGGEAGHAAIVAAAPQPQADGTYAVLVYDSTGSPHGSGDTRLSDPRNAAGPNGRPSGLGSGTMGLAVGPGGVPDHVLWSVGRRSYGGQVQIARAR